MKLLQFKRYIAVPVFFFSLILLLSSFAHDFYVSICQIEQNPAKQTLEISIKVFTNDLEKALDNSYKKKFNLGEPSEIKETNTLLFDYIRQNLSIKVNGQPVVFTFIGKEEESDAMWCYLQVQKVSSLKTIWVQDKILTEVYERQSNIVNVMRNKEVKSLLLDKGNLEGQLLFD